MQKERVVVALGHQALGVTLPEQKENVKKAAEALADLITEGANLVITHSNGAQVGMIHTAMNEFDRAHSGYGTGVPLSVCSAMSQGYIGYDLQNSLRAELIRRGIYRPVATIITQVIVDPYDEALYQPTKVIGRLMNEEEARAAEAKGNYVTPVEGGYRRIIAAPKPQEIVEMDSIRLLLDAGQVVIAGGGGGIPVMEQSYELRGAGAVIEKDLTGSLMAEELRADTLMLLTGVDRVYLDYHTENPLPIGTMTASEARKHIADGQFDANTMLPKIQSAISFVEKGGHRAVITSMARAKEAYLGRAGTVITR